jgi:AcrR family transcriptional regulator
MHTEGKTIVELLGLPPQPTTGKARLIAAGLELFYRYGFQAVGMDQVIELAGVTKTTFYNHFESRDDFMVACVVQRDEWESQAWMRAIKDIAGDNPREQLLAFFHILDRWFNDPEYRGCIFVNVAAEFSDPRHPVHQAAVAHKKKTRDAIRDMAARAGATDAEAFADQFTILLEGTLLLRHVHARNDAAVVALPAVRALLDAFMPAGQAA